MTAEVKLVTILMPLKWPMAGGDEALPVKAFHLGGNHYRVLGKQPNHNRWKFPADAVVRCARRQANGAMQPLVAVALVSPVVSARDQAD